MNTTWFNIQYFTVKLQFMNVGIFFFVSRIHFFLLVYMSKFITKGPWAKY